MNLVEQKKAARAFAENWSNKRGYEKGEAQSFWIDLLTNVFDIHDFSNFIQFELQTKNSKLDKTITNFIDAYIPSTKVMIEQKSSNVNLRDKIKQSDSIELTPFQQAKKYIAALPLSMHPKWVITCNFSEFLIYDMEKVNPEPESILLKDFEKQYNSLGFLIDPVKQRFIKEEEISVKAGVLVGKLYDALLKQYLDRNNENSLRSLNILCVRIVFCLYAEDAGLFTTPTCFEDYIATFSVENLRDGLIKLFKALDTPEDKRDKYDTKTKRFPYVNGGLFCDEDIEIPNFTQEIVDVIVNDCAPFNWSEISPTIFGAVFESTLNPETRRNGGMHYTSLINIHKVIDPLFMDDLNAEFDRICQIKIQKQKILELQKFQQKLGSFKFLDPACGSGNFLTETYLSLRRLENKIISILNKGESGLGFDEFICVHIDQFYGIEINDFALVVAKTALWIAESQMMAETMAILSQSIDFFPLKTNTYIVEGNALTTDWFTLKSEIIGKTIDEGLFSGFANQTDGSRIEYDYIIGNPPFIGARNKSSEQSKDIEVLFKGTKNWGDLDYVAGWYKKAKDYMSKVRTCKTALVSTNSITQGEQVSILWQPLIKDGVIINFAYRTFRWDSESNSKAHVHCVIIGFSFNNSGSKTIFDYDEKKLNVKNINPYLIDGPNVFIESRKNPLCNVEKVVFGSMPNDGGNLLLSCEEADSILQDDPEIKQYIRLCLGAEEFINGKKRYCLWLKNANPTVLKKNTFINERIEKVRLLRSASSRESTKKLADKPYLFGEIRQPENGNYLLIPSTSSERRKYIPIGFLGQDVIATNAASIMPNATLYHFGILTSQVHMAWMRVVCGRLKSDYRYSVNVVYNNFPWPEASSEERERITQTAQAILNARAKYSDSSLADLYDENTMPNTLRKAHNENDKAVLKLYGFKMSITEPEIVQKLFEMYQNLTNKK